MGETQLDRLERKFDGFVEYVQERLSSLGDDVAGIKAELVAFRLDVREQFENLTDRFKLLDSRTAILSNELPKLRRAINDIREEIEQLRLKVEAVESATLETGMRVIQLRDDMQQRFRVINDRLSALDKRLAA